MSEIQKASKELKQEHIDFYNNVIHLEVLNDMHKQTFKKLQSDNAKKNKIENRQKLFLKQFKMFIGSEKELLT